MVDERGAEQGKQKEAVHEGEGREAPDRGAGQGNCQTREFHQRIACGDWRSTGGAAPAQEQPADHGDVVAHADRRGAGRAVGPRASEVERCCGGWLDVQRCQRFVPPAPGEDDRQPMHGDVNEAAAREAERCGEQKGEEVDGVCRLDGDEFLKCWIGKPNPTEEAYGPQGGVITAAEALASTPPDFWTRRIG